MGKELRASCRVLTVISCHAGFYIRLLGFGSCESIYGKGRCLHQQTKGRMPSCRGTKQETFSPLQACPGFPSNLNSGSSVCAPCLLGTRRENQTSSYTSWDFHSRCSFGQSLEPSHGNGPILVVRGEYGGSGQRELCLQLFQTLQCPLAVSLLLQQPILLPQKLLPC